MSATYDATTGLAVIKNGRVELQVETKQGLNPNRLSDVKTGRLYADSDYIWPGQKLPKLIGKPVITKEKDGGRSVSFKASLDSLEITQTFTISGKPDSVLEETISLKNTGSTTLDIPDFACGFAKKTSDDDGFVPGSSEALFTALPFRVNPGTGVTQEYSVSDLQWKQDAITYAPSGWRPVPLKNWPSEAWVWNQNGAALLISKYNTDDLEWSILDSEWQTSGDRSVMSLRFGGASRSKGGDPQGAAQLKPGASFTFGNTRFQMLDGGWKDAYYAYRSLMDVRGHGIPKGYNPPVQWNELYDNRLWWDGDSLENREALYSKPDILAEAQKARDLGCEALYLDPGWDTSFGSMVWGSKRLGPMKDFVKLLSDEYKLKLCLHTPIAPWADPTEFPVEVRLMDKNGNRYDEMCAASSQYGKLIVERHLELCKNGACFLMYDGSRWPGADECWDPSHGHSLPLTHIEHVNAITSIAQQIHKAYPNVLIEQHDTMSGPSEHRYCPMYFMHDKTGGFDEHWGDEHMWGSMSDLLSRRSMSGSTITVWPTVCPYTCTLL